MPSTSSLLAGVAEEDITPDARIDLSGFARRKNPSAGVLDRLRSKSLYLQQGDECVIISSNDVVALDDDFRSAVRAALTGVNLRCTQLNLAASHTHSGPATITLNCCGRINPEYMQMLSSKVTKNIQSSMASPVSVKVGVAEGRIRLNRNRRDGTAGAVDDSVTLVCVHDALTNKVVASICCYACHPVVMGHENLLISGDYTAYLQQTIETATGAPCLFLNGPCADINPIAPEGTDTNAPREMGEQIANAAITAMENIRWLDDTSLQTRTAVVKAPVKQPHSMQEARNEIQEICHRFSLPLDAFQDRLAKLEETFANQRLAQCMDIPLSLTAIGSDLAIIFVPGELFASTGLKIKAISPYKTTIVSTLSNGSVGYLPTPEAFASGGYEPYEAHWFYNGVMFTPELEERLLDGARRLFTGQ